MAGPPKAVRYARLGMRGGASHIRYAQLTMAGPPSAVRYALFDMQGAASHGRVAFFGIGACRGLGRDEAGIGQ